ncbi:MAG TPA: hypothetical protein VE976_00355, partial [Actinomycetota bacterium]|nr:hypothetical protein [Actinomycetota bacterium]
ALLTGVFASLAIDPAGAAGGVVQVARQAAAVGVTLVFSFGATLLLLNLVDRLLGLRVSEADENAGLDLSQHGESAYAFVSRARPAPEPEEELARLREHLVLEATRRVLEAVKEPDPLD